MQVLLHTPAAWFLLQQNDALYLDVNCEISAAGFSLLLELNDEEAARYRAEGRAFVEGLATGIAQRPREHFGRNLPALGEAVSAAVRRWREAGEAGEAGEASQAVRANEADKAQGK